MPIITDGPALEPENKGIDEFHAGRMESLGAAISEAWADNPSVQLYNLNTMPGQERQPEGLAADPLGNALPDMRTVTGPSISEMTAPAVPRIDIMDANHRVKQAGLAPHLKLPDQPDIPAEQLEIMMSRARTRREYEATMERGPGGIVQGTLEVGTSFLVSAVDPLNVASAFIPVMGELRYAKLLAGAGESAFARAGVRAAVGATEGAVGQAAIEPIDWWSHTQDGRDFGMADVLHNILFGAVLGAALHTGGGALSDVYRARKERPMYPYDLGEPLEAHTPWDELRARPAPARDVLGEYPGNHEPLFPEAPEDWRVTQATLAEESRRRLPDVPSEAVQTIDDLPQRAREDAARMGIASLIEGEPLRVGEALEAAAKTDPRIAESFEAWHGSPHEFDRFDLSKVGTGEGAQMYGHGLYFAENADVANFYREALSAAVPTVNGRVAARGDGKFDIVDDFGIQAGPFANREQAEAAMTGGSGSVYQVSVKRDQSHFLDWDKPLSKQSAFIRSLLEPLGYRSDETGKEIYQSLIKYRPDVGGAMSSAGMKLADLAATPEAASGRMAATGIAGIRYLDQGSRQPDVPAEIAERVDDISARMDEIHRMPEESRTQAIHAEFEELSRQLREADAARAAWREANATRNFVVFDDKDVEIIGKNGEPVTPQRAQAEALAEAQPEAVKAKSSRGRAAADPQTWSLYEFLAHEGGLRPDQELGAIFGNARGPFVPGFGPLVRRTGRSLDDALRLAKDHGYMFDAADVTGSEGKVAIRDLLDRIAEENSGRKQYRFDQQFATKADVAAAIEREKHDILKLLHDELDAAGQKGAKVDPALEDRVVQIIQREGEKDVLAAYERAIMEDAERYEGLASERQKHVETAYIP